MPGSMYISDPRTWQSFYKNMLEGNFDPNSYKRRQWGGGRGIAGMYSKRPYMIPVDPHIDAQVPEKIVVGKQVTPTAAVEERAKSELKAAIKEKIPHVTTVKKGIKQKNLKSAISLKKKPTATRTCLNQGEKTVENQEGC